MATTTKDEQRRQRVRDYDAALSDARSTVAVLVQFVTGREARGGDSLLEEAFAATSPAAEHGTAAAPSALPAAVWVTMRQADVDATMDMLMRLSGKEFVLGAHEELDAGYRLTTVEERRPLPDLALLIDQLATFLRIPADVIGVIAGWGPSDPRTTAEIDALLEQRFGSVATAMAAGRAAGAPTRAADPDSDPDSDPHSASDSGAGRGFDACYSAAEPPDGADRAEGVLTLTSAEFVALLHLTPQQGSTLQTLVRQAAIVIGR
jgi:hypothetical protein